MPVINFLYKNKNVYVSNYKIITKAFSLGFSSENSYVIRSILDLSNRDFPLSVDGNKTNFLMGMEHALIEGDEEKVLKMLERSSDPVEDEHEFIVSDRNNTIPNNNTTGKSTGNNIGSAISSINTITSSFTGSSIITSDTSMKTSEININNEQSSSVLKEYEKIDYRLLDKDTRK